MFHGHCALFCISERTLEGKNPFLWPPSGPFIFPYVYFGCVDSGLTNISLYHSLWDKSTTNSTDDSHIKSLSATLHISKIFQKINPVVVVWKHHDSLEVIKRYWNIFLPLRPSVRIPKTGIPLHPNCREGKFSSNESQNIYFGRDLKQGELEPCPCDFWIYPRTETQQPPCATCARAQSPWP